MKVINLGTITKCQNPDKDCPNELDPISAYMVLYKGRPLALCPECGPEFQYKIMLEKTKPSQKP